MTFRRYSRLTSSSSFAETEVAGAGDDVREGDDVDEEIEVRPSVAPLLLSCCLLAQYPAPGFLCFSRSAADDCTLRSSSRKVWGLR